MIAVNCEATIVVKSTVPVGLVQEICAQLGTDQVIFSP
ncbi:UDP-glucose dehydrogenase [Litoreibacter arenae DSM 19593]|uniref:UDP-glucose dehydrogenase n=1 Tax=Litoreibacter arenae DSM 19593 TaxID=1123360 RepID=S9QF87_9RHOB|nr:UDP-glucose dehydrogenase [Litoreibacter arenae DSM 19593]